MRSWSLVVLVACGPKVPDPPQGEQAAVGDVESWSFDEGTTLPGDAEVALGDWAVEAEATAPSAPNVLRQVGTSPSEDFPRLLLGTKLFQDLDIAVQCRPESGTIDQACGLMFRVYGENDYYITRANSIEDNLRLYTVVGGVRTEIASVELSFEPGDWHTLAATARGSAFTVSWDGAELLQHDDDAFAAAGRVGLWTKADSVTSYDELEVTAR